MGEPVDIGLVLFVCAFTWLGLRSGIIHESVTLLGLAAGLLVGGRLAGRFGPTFAPWLHGRGMGELAAFLLILLATWALTIALGSLFRSMLQGVRLGWLDNLGGAVFGALKGLFLAEIVILVLMVIPQGGFREAVMRSQYGSRLAALGPDFLDLVPPVLRYWKPF